MCCCRLRAASVTATCSCRRAPSTTARGARTCRRTARAAARGSTAAAATTGGTTRARARHCCCCRAAATAARSPCSGVSDANWTRTDWLTDTTLDCDNEWRELIGTWWSSHRSIRSEYTYDTYIYCTICVCDFVMLMVIVIYLFYFANTAYTNKCRYITKWIVVKLILIFDIGNKLLVSISSVNICTK